tara:strand:+ start:3127 stop:3258 length:132 start_codon:yes stop_codon:yes gene_type:complete
MVENNCDSSISLDIWQTPLSFRFYFPIVKDFFSRKLLALLMNA